MRNVMVVLFAVVLAGAVAGCDSDANYVRWDVGLHVKGTVNETVVSKEFKDEEGQDPQIFESKGTIDSGTFAGESSGTKTVTATTAADEEWTVVGDTWTGNPLVPGKPEFTTVPVAIVEATQVTSGTNDTIETSTSEQPQGQRHTYTDETFANLDHVTTASTFGMAGDEYVVDITDLNLLWDPDLVEKWHDTRTALPGMDAVVKSNVGVGDFWVSPDGGTLYKGVAKERVDVGGGKYVTATKVQMRKVETVNNDSLVGRCLYVPGDNDVTSHWTTEGAGGAGEGETFVQQVHLDPGCSGSFAHYKTGFQWWSGNVLVAEDSTVFTVKVNDYGYEWLDYQGGKTHKTAKALDPNAIPGDAHLYVQYTYTETHRKWRVTQMNKVQTPWTTK